jgi:hypothetical protein
MGGVLRQPRRDRQRGRAAMTARKTTPHLKRGPKPKPKPVKPSRGRGRPPSRLPLHLHPQRYAVAWTAAMMRFMESERSGAFLMLWWWVLDKKAEPHERSVDRLRKLVASFQTAADLAWRDTMAEAILIATIIGPERPQLAINAMLRRAASARETAWAERVLLPPLIELRQEAKIRDVA